MLLELSLVLNLQAAAEPATATLESKLKTGASKLYLFICSLLVADANWATDQEDLTAKFQKEQQ